MPGDSLAVFFSVYPYHEMSPRCITGYALTQTGYLLAIKGFGGTVAYLLSCSCLYRRAGLEIISQFWVWGELCWCAWNCGQAERTPLSLWRCWYEDPCGPGWHSGCAGVSIRACCLLAKQLHAAAAVELPQHVCCCLTVKDNLCLLNFLEMRMLVYFILSSPVTLNGLRKSWANIFIQVLHKYDTTHTVMGYNVYPQSEYNWNDSFTVDTTTKWHNVYFHVAFCWNCFVAQGFTDAAAVLQNNNKVLFSLDCKTGLSVV